RPSDRRRPVRRPAGSVRAQSPRTAVSRTASARVSTAGWLELPREPPFPGFLTSDFPFSCRMEAGTYITRWGFFRPFTLDSGGLFREIAPANRTTPHELAALPD